MNDISTAFSRKRLNADTDRVISGLLAYEGTPESIKYFADNCEVLDDYTYWFLLSTEWVSYTQDTDIALWRKLFESKRPNRQISLMKPSELKAFKALPNKLTVYRAKRSGETDWLSYTLDRSFAERLIELDDRAEISVGKVKKNDVTAYFDRRGESELLILDHSRVREVIEP